MHMPGSFFTALFFDLLPDLFVSVLETNGSDVHRRDHSLNISPTLRPWWARRITSPSIGAIDKTVSRPSISFSFSGGIGTVSVVTICLTGKAAKRSAAFLEKIG